MHKNAQLIFPCEQYLEGYLQACREYKELNIENSSLHEPNEYDQWKDTIIETYENHSKGIDLPEGFVPYTMFWLVEGEEYIGGGNLRHTLTKDLELFGGHIGYFIRKKYWNKGYGSHQLKLLLQKANEKGIGKALITCDAKNIASAKVIEKNGGKKLGLHKLCINNKLKFIYKYEINTQI